MTKAAIVFSEFAPLPKQTRIVIGNAPPPNSEDDDVLGVATDVSGGVCAVDIIIDKIREKGRTSRRATTEAVLKTTVAHEFFHCVQYQAFPGNVESIASQWWVEGTAEYFAALVVPRTYDRFAADRFDWDSMRLQIPNIGATMDDKGPHYEDTGYPTNVFFSFLDSAEGIGTKALFRLLKSLPERLEAQIDLIAGDAVMRDALRRFAKAYAENDVPTRIEGLPRFPVRPQFGAPLEVDESVELTFVNGEAGLAEGRPGPDLKRFLLYRGLVKLKGPGRYRISTSGAPISVNVDNVWTDDPDGLIVPVCDDETYVFVTSLFATRDAAPIIRIVKDDAGVKPARLSPAALCLIGGWRATPALMKWHFESEIQRAYEGRALAKHRRGDYEYRMKCDGLFDLTLNDIETFILVDGKTTLLMNFRGAAQGDWRVISDGKLGLKLTRDATTVSTIANKIDLGSVSFLGGPPGMVYPEVEVDYDCSAGALTFGDGVWGKMPPGPHFTRIRDPE
ncbi:MAG: hypothetical protein ACK4NP_10115 [Parvularculaceae bacterium]